MFKKKGILIKTDGGLYYGMRTCVKRNEENMSIPSDAEQYVVSVRLNARALTHWPCVNALGKEQGQIRLYKSGRFPYN